MFKLLFNLRVVYLRPPNLTCSCIKAYESLNLLRFIHSKRHNLLNVNDMTTNGKQIKNILMERLNMNETDSELIVKENSNILNSNINKIVKNLETLSNYNVSPYIIIDNISVLTIKPDELNNRLIELSTAHFQHIDHAVPFLKTPFKALCRMCNRIKFDIQTENINRLYFLSDQLKMDPYLISKHLYRRIFIYFLGFHHLQNSLSLLINIGVKPELILKDWWVLKYSSKHIIEKLIKIQVIENDKIKTWMIRCPEDILDRSIDLTLTAKTLLKSETSVQNYMAKRLKCSTETIENMTLFASSIKNIRVQKASNVIDYFLSMGYSETDIINAPRVFAHSQKTIKNRLKILCDNGLRPSHLHVLCVSSQLFKRYVNHSVNLKNK